MECFFFHSPACFTIIPFLQFPSSSSLSFLLPLSQFSANNLQRYNSYHMYFINQGVKFDTFACLHLSVYRVVLTAFPYSVFIPWPIEWPLPAHTTILWYISHCHPPLAQSQCKCKVTANSPPVPCVSLCNWKQLQENPQPIRWLHFKLIITNL